MFQQLLDIAVLLGLAAQCLKATRRRYARHSPGLSTRIEADAAEEILSTNLPGQAIDEEAKTAGPGGRLRFVSNQLPAASGLFGDGASQSRREL